VVDSEDETVTKSQPSQQPPAEQRSGEGTKAAAAAAQRGRDRRDGGTEGAGSQAGSSAVAQREPDRSNGAAGARSQDKNRVQQRSGGRTAEAKEQRPTDGKAHTSDGWEGKKPRGHPATKEVRSNGERHGGQWTARQWAEWREQQGANANQPQRENRGQNQRAAGKRQCQFDIGIEEDSKFGVVRRLLGSRGANVKAINEATGAKLRLRGRGSKFLEGPEQRESEDPLMLCVSIPDPAKYDEVIRLISELLEDIYSEYRSFCSGARIPVPDLRIHMHEGSREGAR
jgi:hypothetical protein